MPNKTVKELFPEVLSTELINKVKGKSTLAKLSGQMPIPFIGTELFTFAMDSEIDIVAENGKKSHGGVTVDPVKVVPIKFEYGARVSDEFMTASEEQRINMMQSFTDGFARKVAKGLDIAAFHGVNPRTGTASDVVGNNCFDKAVTQTVVYTAAKANDVVESAIALVEGAEHEVTGLALSTQARSDLAKLEITGGAKMFPELAWGASPEVINGLKADVNTTVANATVKDRAIVGDFEGMVRWGFGKDMFFEVIEYGDPDNSGKDLKGHNQVYLRGEVFLGWGILDPNAFARAVEA